MLKGKSVIVTGATSGIGLGIARAFAAQGCNVMLNGFGDAVQIEKLRAGIAEEHKVVVLYSSADMSKPPEITAMVDQAARRFGTVDVLVNNAGIQHVAPVEEFPVDKWDQILAINLSSAFHAIRAALPGMKSRNWGRILNVASAHGLVASPFKSAYVAAKHGLVASRATRFAPVMCSPHWSRSRSTTKARRTRFRARKSSTKSSSIASHPGNS